MHSVKSVVKEAACWPPLFFVYCNDFASKLKRGLYGKGLLFFLSAQGTRISMKPIGVFLKTTILGGLFVLLPWAPAFAGMRSYVPGRSGTAACARRFCYAIITCCQIG
jgi:hypothetical protein